MAFGKRRNTEGGDSETHVSNTQGFIDTDDEVVEQTCPASASQASASQASEKDQNKPLVDEVTYHGAGNSKNPGGCKQWTCNHCKGKFTSTYTRIHIHFFGPAAGKKAEIKRCPTVLRDRAVLERLLKKVREAENCGISKCLKYSVLSKSGSSNKRIDESFGILERNAVDLKIIRGLCANGIPFNVLRNPQFLEMISAIKHAPDGYKPPSCEKARTVLLDECVRDVEKDLTPVKDTWYTQGVSIVSDGWTNVKHSPLINVLAVNCRGAMFMYAEDFLGVEKTGVAISKFLLGAIETIGPSNVLQVVTDNAANCKAAGREIEKVYNHIFWSPCCVHTLNLIFKDLAIEFFWLNETYKKGKGIVKYFLNHTHALSFFRENSKLELLKVAKTRFASHYILLRRLMDCREALATTIALNSWRDFVKSGDENTRTVGAKITDTIKDDIFWEDVEHILAITYPIFLLIKFCDGEGPKMGEIYERMDNMVGEIKDAMRDNKYSIYFPQVEAIVLARWEKMTIPLHCLGFALNPKFYDKYYLEKLAPGGIERRAPNLDKEVVIGVMEAFKRIAENEEEQKILREQFATFHMKKGIYSRSATQADAVTMDVIDWWATYGAETPELAEVAKKILSQPISSSSAERNWSTYSYIHNVKRNRLNVKRADKLVFIHSNIRLQSRFSDSYKSGPHKKWDMNPENAYIEGSSARLEEMVWEDLEDEGVNNGKGKRQRLD
ncbi:hypothetical protein L1987_10752 [Smallanthus sonchifolius]|uniref:Uncharacterized protein n=1 Tax=Smallanthus sonchifolius TaxID=185202 RepID=A0ACB9J9D5_9ASTR|nr:hypothetical protein L1987_10752 [Smallanthus sonchifolius]